MLFYIPKTARGAMCVVISIYLRYLADKLWDYAASADDAKAREHWPEQKIRLVK